MTETGSDQLFHTCVDVIPNKPDGRLFCPTKINTTSKEMIYGDGQWGFCEEKYCPTNSGIIYHGQIHF